MDWNLIMQAVTTIGFPIVMCGAMSYYVKYITDKNREEIKETNLANKDEIERITQQHKEEVEKITDAVNNNTIALTKLCEKLGGM